jgi:hypothetical protein
VTVAVVILAITVASSLGVIVWLVHGRVSSVEDEAQAHVERAEVETHLERTMFELDVTKKALDAANKRAAALQEVLSHELERAPNPDLARADVAGRVQRIFERWQAADAARDGALPAEPGKPVPVDGPAEPARAPALPAGAGDVH